MVVSRSMFSKQILALAGVTACVTAAPVLAHHSFAMFDTQKTVTLNGTVKEFEWTNPHSWIMLMVMDPQTGDVVQWSIETGGPADLTRHGWKRTSLMPGDKATVLVHPLKNGKFGGDLMSATVNGVTLSFNHAGG
jgi:hypothetical protein